MNRKVRKNSNSVVDILLYSGNMLAVTNLMRLYIERHCREGEK